MAKIYVLQHHPVENLGNIADALEGNALAWQYVRVAEGQAVPASMKGAGGLIVMGGPMGVYQTDRYPWLRDEMRIDPIAVGHRVVHGGPDYDRPVLIDHGVVARLERLVPLAPLHQPHNLAPIKSILNNFPTLPQVACFDTAFQIGRAHV